MVDSTGGTRYDPIAVSAESTFVAEHLPEVSEETAYQSEAELERAFIRLLDSQAYEYLPLTSEAQLIANLRTQLEALNDSTFSEAEWERFFSEGIAGADEGIIDRTVRIQEDHVLRAVLRAGFERGNRGVDVSASPSSSSSVELSGSLSV